MESKTKFRPDRRLKLMDQVRQVMRYHHYAYRTEKTYSDWILRYIRFFGAKYHPKDMGKPEIESFLSHLATKENVSASTQRQTLNALIFYIVMFWTNPLMKISPGDTEKFICPGHRAENIVGPQRSLDGSISSRQRK